MEPVQVQDSGNVRRRKWRPANPLSSMTLRGMRQPKPVGLIGDDAMAIAQAVYRHKRKVRYPVRVYIVGLEVYALAETYAITDQADRNPKALLIGVYTRRATVADISSDITAAQAEILARV